MAEGRGNQRRKERVERSCIDVRVGRVGAAQEAKRDLLVRVSQTYATSERSSLCASCRHQLHAIVIQTASLEKSTEHRKKFRHFAVLAPLRKRVARRRPAAWCRTGETCRSTISVALVERSIQQRTDVRKTNRQNIRKALFGNVQMYVSDHAPTRFSWARFSVRVQMYVRDLSRRVRAVSVGGEFADRALAVAVTVGRPRAVELVRRLSRRERSVPSRILPPSGKRNRDPDRQARKNRPRIKKSFEISPSSRPCANEWREDATAAWCRTVCCCCASFDHLSHVVRSFRACLRRAFHGLCRAFHGCFRNVTARNEPHDRRTQFEPRAVAGSGNPSRFDLFKIQTFEPGRFQDFGCLVAANEKRRFFVFRSKLQVCSSKPQRRNDTAWHEHNGRS